MVQADGETGVVAGRDLAYSEQDARHEGDAVEAVGANRQLLAGVAEQDLLVGVETAKTHRVHVDAVNHLAARAAVGLCIVRDSAKTGILPCFGDGVSSVDRRAGRRIYLVRMMQFDHLSGFEIGRRNLREIVRQHRGNREIRGDEHALVFARGLRERSTDLVEFLVGPSGCADNHVDALGDESEHVVQRNSRHSEFDDDIGVFRGDLRKVVTRIERKREARVLRPVHRFDHVRPHASLGADDGNLDHVRSLPDSGRPLCHESHRTARISSIHPYGYLLL